MKGRFLSIIISLIAGIVLLLLLPPGMSERLANGIRLVTQPVQSWSDLVARVARAAVGETEETTPATAEQGSVAALRRALAMTQEQFAAAQVAHMQLKHELKLFNANSGGYDMPFTMTLARVIKRDPLSSYYDSIVIARVSNDGLKPGQYVVAIPPPDADGASNIPELIGMVTDVSATTALVQLITSPDIAVPCHIPERSITGLLVGLKEGNISEPHIVMPADSLLMSNPEGISYDMVQIGDPVFTSAIGDNTQCVPNLYIGKVAAVGQDDDGMPEIMLEPAASLGQFTHVLVVLQANQRSR